MRRHSAFLASSLALLAVGSAAAAQTPGRPVTETGFVQVEPGIRLRYARIGHGSQAVVAPMGFLLQDSFRRLARNDRTLVLYDPRGRGRSDAVDASRVSFANELEDLERIRRHFGFGRMALIGWSHYGMMTAVYAIQNPSRVSRLIQMTPGSPARTPYLEEGMRTMQERVDGAAWKTLQERIRAGEFAADPEGRCRATKRLVLEAFVADRADVARIPLEDCLLPNEWEENQNRWWEALFGSMGDWDYRREARSLSVPRLVIHGEKDFIPAGGSRDWAAGAEQARLLVLKEAGHFPHIERPDFFFPAVDRFLDGSWPDGAEMVSGTSPSAPPGGGEEDEIRGAELARQDAIRTGNREALERLYADDFVGVASNGRVVDKAGALALIGRPDPRLTFTTDELTARRFGAAGVAMGRITGRGPDGKVAFAFRFLHLYEKRGDRWVTVAGQSTNLPAQ